MVLFESRRKLQYFTFDQSNDQMIKSRQDVQKKGKQNVNNILAGSFMADRSTFKWLLTGENNQKKYFVSRVRF